MEVFSIFIALLLIAFFSGIEIAFVSANKLRVELLKEKGSSSAKIISGFNSNPSRFISTMLIGLNIAVVLFGSIAETYFSPERLGFGQVNPVSWLIVQTVVTTFIILIFGELIPKILFRVNSDQTLLLFAYPVKLVYVLLSPLTNLFHSLARWILQRLFSIQLREGGQDFTEEDLEYLVKETAVEENDTDEADHLNSEIFEKALYLKDIKVRNCMIPRPEIQSFEVTDSLEDLRKMFIETKLSRIIVYDEMIDKIMGYVHHFDMLKEPKAVRTLIRPILTIPDSMTARDLLLQFIRERKNMAWVVDEYGGTAGIITLEDLMEEIFGEIEDEHDEEDLTEKKVSANEYVFSGRLEIDYLNNEYDLDIPEGDYATLSGYIISNFEDLPEAGTEIDMDHFHVKILRASETRIDVVSLVLKPEK
jgi:CBS domain containing-hemolysin-like protein